MSSSNSHDQAEDRVQRATATQAQPETKEIDSHVFTSEDNPWLFTAEEVAETPSRLHDLPKDVEMRVIAKTAKFMHECSGKLVIPQLTTSVAIKLFQRFFMLESMLVHSPPLVAAACLFLSCKVQETLRRLREVIYWTVKVRTRNTPDYPDGMEMVESSPGYFEEKNNILDKEREVLRVLNFDLNIDHPYRHLWTLTRMYLPPGDDQKRVTQGAWNFCNDSFLTYVHMRYDAKEIATAMVFLSAKLHHVDLPDGTQHDPASGKRLKAWHELYNVDLHRVDCICNELLDLYDPDANKAAKSVMNGAGVLDSVPQLPPAKRRKIDDTEVPGNAS